jgi:hypothetical protein
MQDNQEKGISTDEVQREYKTKNPGGGEIFRTHTPFLGPTQSPIKWVSALFVGGKTVGAWR